MKYLIVFIIVLVTSIGSVLPQPGRIENPNLNKRQSIFTQCVINPFGNNDSITVHTFVRVAYRSLLFKKMKDQESYYSVLNFDLNCRNNDNIIKDRKTSTDTIWATSLNEIELNNSYYIKNFSSILSNEKYISNLEVMDENKKVISSVKMPEIKADIFRQSSYSHSLIMAYGLGDKYYPMVLDSAFDFKVDNMYLFIPFRSDNSISQITYSIKCIEKNYERGFTYGELSVQNGNAEVSNSSLNFINSEINIKNSDQDKLIKIKLNREIALPGKYEIRYKLPNSSEEIVSKFDIIYLNQPLSLAKQNTALLAMEYLMNEQEYSALKSADDEKFYEVLNQFWIKEDPTPETNYNEAMAEFFRRIDYSMVNYRDPQNPDGSRTARGKIYALYGSPDKIDVKPESDKTIETWNYTKLKKSIIFEVSSGGFYKIVEILQDGKSQNK